MSGTLYLIPTLLDENGITNCIPKDVVEIALSLKSYIVENAKVSRRFLKKLDSSKDINVCQFYSMGKHANEDEYPSYLKDLLDGEDMGLMSDAGCPAIADPGNVIVKLAHDRNIRVVPLTGPSSILLSLMASGMNGQSFTFHGYLPHDQKEKESKIKSFERNVIKEGQTQIFMETPFRNNKIIQDVIRVCQPSTRLCVASSLTGENEKIISKPISEWKSIKYDFHKIPAMICLGL